MSGARTNGDGRQEAGRPLRVAFVTIGCKANVADTRMLAESLASAGLELAEAPPDGDGDAGVDVFVLNTCTVTHRADADARAAVRRLRRAHPRARIVATGCLAEVTPESLEALPEVDAVLGNRAKSDLGSLLAAVAPPDGNARNARIAAGPGARSVAADTPDALTGSERPIRDDSAPPAPVAFRPAAAIRDLPPDRSRPFVKVQDGCDRACTYCIIPRARGRSRSLSPDDVLATLRRYGELGAAEVVLTGIHVGLYGRDLPGGGPDLVELLARIDDEAPVPRIRLSSLEPDEVDERLLALLERPRFCPHLHLPLQSGDDDVLRRMGRPYTTADFRAVVTAARAASPRMAIGADVIVGFPGESEAAFERTLAFVGGLPLTYLHVFTYSPRAGTPAASYPEQVSPSVAKARTRRLRAVGSALRARFHESLAGTVAEVLVQGALTEDRFRGLTDNYVPVELDAPGARPGRLVRAVLGAPRGARVAARAR